LCESRCGSSLSEEESDSDDGATVSDFDDFLESHAEVERLQAEAAEVDELMSVDDQQVQAEDRKQIRQDVINSGADTAAIDQVLGADTTLPAVEIMLRLHTSTTFDETEQYLQYVCLGTIVYL
jgi:hypothetical protein